LLFIRVESRSKGSLGVAYIEHEFFRTEGFKVEQDWGPFFGCENLGFICHYMQNGIVAN
jgi:hypothetical protein